MPARGNASKKQQGVPIALRKKTKTTKFLELCSRYLTFDVTKLFERRRGALLPRTVYFGLPLPQKAWAPTKAGAKQLASGADANKIERKTNKKAAEGWEYPSNQVITSKYNLITFLPRNLLEQFRRVANVFFLILVILQFFPRFSNVSPALAALPLLVVLAITALKDGYEDLKRHQSDRNMNNLPVRVMHADSFHNPNITERKEKMFSLKTLGLGFLLENKPSKKELKDNAALEKNPHNATFIDNEKPSAHSRRHWWGARRTKGPGPPKSAPGGGNVEGAKSTKHTNGDAEKSIKPPTYRIDTEYDMLPEGESEDGDTSYGSKGRPRWKAVTWEDLRVGDFVKLTNNEAVPADIVICATSEEEDVAYVETKNLDGETNLKSRSALPELTKFRTAQQCARARFFIEADAPTVDMFKYSATLNIPPEQDGGEIVRAPITLSTVLLRGTVVRNTEWAIGVVMATGIDSKIVLNSGGTPSKRSKVERQMNPQVFVNLFLLALMCIMCAVGDHILEVRYYREDAYWNIFANLSGDNPDINGLVAFANAMITFQNIVPISLYISIEFVKLVQAFFIWADDDMLYEKTGRRTTARSWNLSDDCGQIEYVFSDKTGTLTQNVMQFRHCTIGGKIYKGDDKVPPNTIVEKSNSSSDGGSSSDDTAVNSTQGSKKSPSENAKGTDPGHPKVKLADDVYAPFHDSQITRDLNEENSEQSRLCYGFFMNLALCHTVLAQQEADGVIQYKAQSPDEAALVQAAADVGFIFLGREKNILRISSPADKDPVEYELLNLIEFTSARKRMSVFVRRVDDVDGRIFLLIKGADNVIFERLATGQESLKKTTDQHLDHFANEGLRTLTLGYRDLDIETYQAWEKRYNEASTEIDDREGKMEAVADEIEKEITLLGATAIEDKLQDGVPETLVDLKRMGVKVWVCTGDKLETAVAIGMSSHLLTDEMNLIIIRGGSIDESNSASAQMCKALNNFFGAGDIVQALEQHHGIGSNDDDGRPAMARLSTNISGISDIVGENNGNKSGGYGLVIDGTSLKHAFSEPFTKNILLELSTRCDVVICCRTSPLQKALVVRLVKEGLGAMCLAIGDGANDVSMIQAADVGVGVAGEEGLQAVNSSDYAIGQFRYLKRLLLVHGLWDYMRNSNMIVNFFYKEIIGIGVLFFFQFYCAFSTTTVYEYTYLLFWNVFWTLIPVIAIGCVDRNIDAHVLMHVPEVYRYGRDGLWFGLGRFSLYMLDGIYQSAICFFFVLYAYDVTTTRTDGIEPGLYEFSTLMAVAAVFCANFYNGLNTYSWTWMVFVAVLIGPILIVGYTLVYSAIQPGWIWTRVYGNNTFLWPSAIFWFSWIFVFIVSLAPRYLIRYYGELYRPNDIDILRMVGKFDPKHDYYNDPLIPGGAQADYLKKETPRDPDQPVLQRQRTDMSNLQPISSRGFAYDEAPPNVLRTYTSRSSHQQQTSGTSAASRRARSGSVQRVASKLGFPSLRKKNRERGDSSASLTAPPLTTPTNTSSGRKRGQSRLAELFPGSPNPSTTSQDSPRQQQT